MSSNDIKPFRGQDYEQLKSKHDSENLFEDPLFPPIPKSMYHTQTPPHGIVWKRPFEAMSDPEFVVGGFERIDMDQGQLGNCWFIAACVDIVQSPKLLSMVVPSDQSFSEDYAGIFHFRFWLYGKWVDVVIDDKLPYLSDGRLVFCSNKEQPSEFWSPLLEKAYAKYNNFKIFENSRLCKDMNDLRLYGSYENLDAGQTYDALIDMTGGIQEQFELKSLSSADRSKMWTYLEKGFKKEALLGCSINPDPRVKEARMSNGLVRGHAYSITKVTEINGTRLLRIRNPWGNDIEWKGAWSDNSSEWSRLSEDEKSELDFKRAPDGEFWMNFNDFMSSWDQVQICHLSADSFSSELLESDNDSDLRWKCTTYQSKWVKGMSAGGCGQSSQAKFWTNPQFFINLTDVDNDDNQNLATMIVTLMQKDSRLKRIQTKKDSCEEYIQFRLFKIKDDVDIDESKNSGLKLYANQLDRVGTSGSYINSRDVTKRFRVEPGNYLIIPSTYDENRDSEFMLRIFTQEPIEGSALPNDKDGLDEDEITYVPEEEDVTKKNWTNILNPKVFKKVKDLGRRAMTEYNNYQASGSLNFDNIANLARDGMDVINNDLGGLNMNKIGGFLKGKFFK